MKRLLLILVLAVALVGAFLWLRADRTAEAGAQASLLPLLSGDDIAGFARATEPGAMTFPEALGPHPDYQTEWWYYTGNLQTADNRQFGFQLTFFRRALSADPLPQPTPGGDGSAWRTNQLYMAHFTVSDIDGEAFYPEERFARGAAGLAGAQTDPYRVWLEEWYAEQVGPDQVRLYAATDDVALDLVLTETLPPILHGDRGLSIKGPEPGNASYYYSIVQQQTSGTVTVQGQPYKVTGVTWKDHEYSTSALSPGAIGWDWFSLQFDNGGALMFFQIRREDGTLQAESSGTFVYPDGRTVHVPLDDWQVEVTDTWTSPESGATYPAGWRITIPSLDLTLEGAPLLANQELGVSSTYWEGAVQLTGTWQGEKLSATGYIELTGYAETMEGRL